MIVARGVILDGGDDGQCYYDYGGCLYPEGLLGRSALYFNHEAVCEVMDWGYSDTRDAEYVETLVDGIKGLSIPRASPGPLDPDDSLPREDRGFRQGGTDG
jgi:hypothetical protein